MSRYKIHDIVSLDLTQSLGRKISEIHPHGNQFRVIGFWSTGPVVTCMCQGQVVRLEEGFYVYEEEIQPLSQVVLHITAPGLDWRIEP